MKNIFLMIGLLLSFNILAQMPLPCLRYDNLSAGRLYESEGDIGAGCLEIDMYQSPYDITDDVQRRFTVGEGVITPGFSYSPEESGELSITLGEPSAMVGAWFEPADHYWVPQYEKTEWGIKLPDEIEAAIDNWIMNQNDNTDIHQPSINPFDDEQIEIIANVYNEENGSWSQQSQPIWGFFYRDFNRITEQNNPQNLTGMDDPDNWFWQEHINPFRFRIRFAPKHLGWHKVSIKLVIDGELYARLADFEFESAWNDPSKSFITTSPNGKYFSTADGQVFFPIGMNMWRQGTCQCEMGTAADAFINPDCPTCYLEPNDVCCDAGPDARYGPYKGFAPHVQDVDVPVNFVRYLQQLNTFSNTGANTFRIMLSPWQHMLEFEKLNNYYDRQFLGWEMDKLIEEATSLNMRIELCMMHHWAITHDPNVDLWDWSDVVAHEPSNNHQGYCYSTDSLTGCTNDPVTFFEEEGARKYYKKYIKYFIARYGYSPAILDIEFISEINNVGTVDSTQWDLPQYELLGNHRFYEDPSTQLAIGNWHDEMGAYIKNSLYHRDHLLAADYTGRPQSQYGCIDESWYSTNLDAIAFSSYDSWNNRFQKMADLDNDQTEWNELTCAPENNYYHILRPVIHAEQGSGWPLERLDETQFKKDLWCCIFGGYASSGMPWHYQVPSDWWQYFGIVNSFFKNQLLELGNIGQDQNWKPQFAHSTEDNDNWKLEVISLCNEEEGNQRAAGIIMNRTWNRYIIDGHGQNLSISDSILWFEDKSDWNFKDLEPFYEINAGTLGCPKIRDMGACNSFSIKYFDANTLSLIGTSDDDTDIHGKLKLKDLPSLTMNRPMILYVAERNGNCIFNQALGEEQDQELDNNVQRSVHIETTSNAKIYPNPFSDRLTLSLNELPCILTIYDISGRIVYSNSLHSILTELDTDFLASGSYQAEIVSSHENFIFKLEKQ